MKQPNLFDPPVDAAVEPELPESAEPARLPPPPDQAARDFAIDPANDVVLEASAGTGKTRVLVDRYLRLIEAGVDPRHILAMTFTRKAAAEMRERVLAALARRVERGGLAPEIWRGLRDRLADIQISTIDAFCFGLLREFPLEADVDPAFEIADETEMARFTNEALDLTLRAARGLITHDEHVRLVFTRVSLPALREAIGGLIDRRHVARPAVARFVDEHVHVASGAEAGATFVNRLRDLFEHTAHRAAFFDDGPVRSAEFRWLADDLKNLDRLPADNPARVLQLQRRLERYFLTKDGRNPRAKAGQEYPAGMFHSADAKKRHDPAVKALAVEFLAERDRLASEVNGLLARGLLRLLAIAARSYEALLDEHALLDFAGMLARTVALLERQEEFARSRLKLQARYHHLLVDEFQDTSRLQWRLVELLVDTWGEGEGAADAPTSIFIVGDRKQSIYRFRHAEVTLLDEAARKIAWLRPNRPVRQAIRHSYRAVPELLAFVNALSEEMQSPEVLDDRFTFADADRFPAPDVAPGARRDGEPVLGLIAQPTMAACAAAVAGEVERLLAGATVRDREGGPPRAVRPDDIAILFRARTGHQYFEDALESRGIRTYVYKGLGFFDAPEVQDLQALVRYLAQPDSNLRAAELLRSRLVRLSDDGLVRLACPEPGRGAPSFAAALRSPSFDSSAAGLSDLDRALLDRVRSSLVEWLPLARYLTPSGVVDVVLRDAAYAFELRGRRLDQARENLKKVRSLMRRVENRGYATLGRLADYFETLRTGEESNAVVEAAGCVQLMTIHAAKGLEFPVVFLVNVHVPGRTRPMVSVIERGPTGEPDVAFQTTDATRHEEKREAEELRRLLYVAATRARDRFYLAGEVDDKARLRRGARSLAALLPGGVSNLFGAAAASEEVEVTWQRQADEFAFRVCRPIAAAPPSAGSAAPAAGVVDASVLSVTQGAPLRTTDPAVLAAPRPGSGQATDGVQPVGTRPADDDPSEARRDRMVLGSVVHRLFQRRVDPSLDEAAVARLAARLIRPDEAVGLDDVDGLVARAAGLYVAFARREDVRALLAGGDCHFEVPVSFQSPDGSGAIVRGAIDCLVVSPDGRATVIELKTGSPRPEHDRQAALYALAIEAALGSGPVDMKLLYP